MRRMPVLPAILVFALWGGCPALAQETSPAYDFFRLFWLPVFIMVPLMTMKSVSEERRLPGGMPADVVLFARQLETPLETGARSHPLVLDRAQELERNAHVLLHVLDREAAVQEEAALGLFHVRALEADHRILFGIEELGAPEVVVALLDARVDAGRLHRHDDRASLQALLVEGEGAADVVGRAVHLRDPEVADGESDARVRPVDLPLGGPSEGGRR